MRRLIHAAARQPTTGVGRSIATNMSAFLLVAMLPWTPAVSKPGLLAGAEPASSSVVVDPTVTGPVPSGRVGGKSRNYPFGASAVSLEAYGYVEEEYFFSGVTAGGQYTSRMIVRRPADSARFSGDVLAEWTNVSLLHDFDCFWARSAKQLMRTGDAYVAIDAQTEGVNNPATGLKAWNSERYAPLHIPTSGYFVGELGAYEIFGQALQTLREPADVAPLGGLSVERLYATGCSQSSATLGIYESTFGLAHHLVDGYLSVALSTNTTDYPGELVYPPGGNVVDRVPFLQLNTESDHGKNALPDSDTYRLWEVAGAVHHDADAQRYLERLQLRDFGKEPADLGCAMPPLSRIPLRDVQAAAYEQLKRWVATGAPPPSQPRFRYSEDGSVRENSLGLARGGIRLPQIGAPIADNGVENSGPDIGCNNFYGHHIPFGVRRLKRLYPTHRAYVTAFKRSGARAVADGVLLPADAARAVNRARHADVPRDRG